MMLFGKQCNKKEQFIGLLFCCKDSIYKVSFTTFQITLGLPSV